MMPIYSTLPISHGMDRLHMDSPLPCLQPPRTQRLSLGTFNIRDGRGFGLAQAIRAALIGRFDLLILM